MLIITKPTLLLNEDICRKNIHAMAQKANQEQVMLRPHFKTHQSATIGEWFREEGVTNITVSSVSMATYFAQHGWNDITIAFPVNLLEIDGINRLASVTRLQLLIESEETAIFLIENLTSDCGFFIKIDTGYHRTGIEPSNRILIDRIINITRSMHLYFAGFMTHSGHAYHISDRQELVLIQQYATEILLGLKKHYDIQYPGIIISVGDTPTCSQLPLAKGIDEIRPGNFVFFDIMQYALGSCKPEDIAVALVCPVVAMHPQRAEAVIYGGAVHLSKEQTLLLPDQEPVFGLVVNWDGQHWNPAQLLGKVKSLSQEHGIISLTGAGLALKPGDLIAILPVHSCLTASLMRNYYLLDGAKVETMNT